MNRLDELSKLPDGWDGEGSLALSRNIVDFVKRIVLLATDTSLQNCPEIWDFLAEVWETMKAAIHRGLDAEGVLPGPLNLRRKASAYYIRSKGYKDSLRSRGLVFAYALAVSEENASGGKIVTAPTCGACGVVPAVLYHLQKSRDFSDARILRALATAGLVGNIVKHNASISGAEAGCQAEVGVACSMASAAASQLFGGSPAQIEYAAEMGLEHHLGMTCDPVCGLVQIPCIERNAYVWQCRCERLPYRSLQLCSRSHR